MIEKEDILGFLRAKKAEFLNDYKVIKIALFGSFAKNQANEQSDIDVLVKFLPNTEDLTEKKAKIKSIIEQKFNRKVDLCREKYIKPYFKAHITNSAICV